MKPIDQVIFDPGKGDCMAACIASILELPLDAVPNLSNLPKWNWTSIFISFMYHFGWEFEGMGYSSSINADEGIHGYYIAGVPSANFKDCEHAIVIDRTGLCVHDPSPKKQYQGVNVIEEEKLIDFYSFVKREDEEWQVIEEEALVYSEPLEWKVT